MTVKDFACKLNNEFEGKDLLDDTVFEDIVLMCKEETQYETKGYMEEGKEYG